MNLLKKIRHIVRWFTPYGIVRWYSLYNKKSNKESTKTPEQAFVIHLNEYLSKGLHVNFDENSPFEKVVSVQGFGFSGSGAVVDLLREYNSTLVLGNVDQEGSVASKDQDCQEFDILRLAGGLFEVENFLGKNNIFQNDALLHRVIAQIVNSEIYNSMPSARPYFYEYINQICEVLTNSPQYQNYNTYLDYKGNNEICYLKDISIKEYRDMCRKFLNSLFRIIKGEHKKHILVLDQFVGDLEFDTEKYLNYIPNLKILTVYRDPRDMYMFAKIKDVSWIPHQSAEVFISWYNIMTRYFNIYENEKYKAIQFEKLINNYEDVVHSIETYVGLNKANHIRRYTCLDPNVSRKNIKIWQDDNENIKENQLVFSKLHPFCYLTK